MMFPMSDLSSNDLITTTDVINHLRREGNMSQAAEITLNILLRTFNDSKVFVQLTEPYQHDDLVKWLHDLIGFIEHFEVSYSQLITATKALFDSNKSFSSSGSGNDSKSISTYLIFINSDIRSRYALFFFQALQAMTSSLFTRWFESKETHIDSILKTVSSMRRFGWLYLYRIEIIKALEGHVENYINETCKGQHANPTISQIKTWFQHSFCPFCDVLLGSNSEGTIQLEKFMISTFCRVRSEELFEMVGDYPESLPSLRELRDAVAASSSLRSVGKIFRGILRKRLLHPGASTSQILDMYVSTIRSLRVIDPSDLLLTYVAEPVRHYLMSRKDTVRCIVSSLTADGGSDLHGELRRGGSLECAIDEDDEEDGPGMAWEPAKRDAELAGDGGRGQDILALLVSIYGSTALFVTEYRSLLSDKLISNLAYDADTELANLELLKKRFGDESLHSCEVMLHDLEDSKRVNAAIASAMQKDGHTRVVDSIIISDNYWPTLRNSDPIRLHPTAAQELSRYEESYAVLRNPRRLRRLPQLGSVELDLEFDDGTTRAFSASPIQASMVMYLMDGGTDGEDERDDTVKKAGRLKLTELAALSEQTEAMVRSTMGFWVRKRVVRELIVDNALAYEVIEAQAGFVDGDVEIGDGGDVDRESGSESVAGAGPTQSGNGPLDGYIRGMLSNMETMTIERMHSMLRMMSSASQGVADGAWTFDMNMVQFRRYLQSLVDTDVLEFAGDGRCRLRRP